MKEAAEMKDKTEDHSAFPLYENLFEWHFTIRGSPDSDFKDGIYHGRIMFPPEYPLRPPHIMLLTVCIINFSVKIITCLKIILF